MKWSRTEASADFDLACKQQYYKWRKDMSILNSNYAEIREAASRGVERTNRIDLILEEIALEVERAKLTWGEDFDRKNTLNDWVIYSMSFAADATRMDTTLQEQETYLRKAAGLLVSAIDMLQREGFAPRHYEGQTQPESLPEIK